MEDDENLEDDMGVVYSSWRGALTGGGEASRNFSSQKNLQSQQADLYMTYRSSPGQSSSMRNSHFLVCKV